MGQKQRQAGRRCSGRIELKYAGVIVKGFQYSKKYERRMMMAEMMRYARHCIGAYITVIPDTNGNIDLPRVQRH